MRSKTIIFGRLVPVVCLAFVLLSCASKTTLSRGGMNSDSKLSVLELAPPTAEKIEHATLRHRSYLPSDVQNIWIERIDGEPGAKFIVEAKNSVGVRRYQLPPGKHEIALMYEADGLSDKCIPMFEDSLQITYSYKSRLKKPLLLEVDTAAGTSYIIKTHVPKGKCTISLMRNDVVVAENTGVVRYWFSNALHAKNRHLNEHLMSH